MKRLRFSVAVLCVLSSLLAVLVAVPPPSRAGTTPAKAAPTAPSAAPPRPSRTSSRTRTSRRAPGIYTRLVRAYNSARGHWASSRRPPPGFTAEATWRLWRRQVAGTVPLFECRVGGHNLLTRDPRCKGQQPLGPVGHINVEPAPGTVKIYRCLVPGNGDHFISPRPGCEGQRQEGPLGYAISMPGPSGR